MTEFEKEILSLLRKIDEKLDILLGTESAKTATPPEDEYVKWYLYELFREYSELKEGEKVEPIHLTGVYTSP